MNVGVVFMVFVLQVMLAVIVVVVLKHFLSKELVGVALEQWDALKPPRDISDIKEIVVISHAPLMDSITARIKSGAERKFKGVPLRWSTDPALKGGLVIVAGQSVIDYSAKNRLDKLWGVGE